MLLGYTLHQSRLLPTPDGGCQLVLPDQTRFGEPHSDLLVPPFTPQVVWDKAWKCFRVMNVGPYKKAVVQFRAIGAAEWASLDAAVGAGQSGFVLDDSQLRYDAVEFRVKGVSSDGSLSPCSEVAQAMPKA